LGWSNTDGLVEAARGKSLRMMGLYDEAVKALDDAIGSGEIVDKAEQANILLNRAFALEKLNQNDQAIETAKQILSWT
jgi:tetratricopeptide (TPR) repeat protein